MGIGLELGSSSKKPMEKLCAESTKQLWGYLPCFWLLQIEPQTSRRAGGTPEYRARRIPYQVWGPKLKISNKAFP